MMELGRRARVLVSELVVALVCVWTGYFATHTWKTLNAVQVSLLCAGAAFCVAGAQGACLLIRRGDHTVAAWCSAGAAVTGILLSASAGPRAALAAGVLLLVVVISSRLAWRSPGRQFLSGLGFALAAALVGFAAVLPVSAWTSMLVLALAAYVGLTEAARGDPPVSKTGFAALLALMIGTVLVVGAVALGRPYNLLGAALALWLAARLGIVGVRVLRSYTAGRVLSFAEHAQLGVGLMAGALLTLGFADAGPDAAAELAWPVIAGAFSFVLMRLWPLVANRGAGR